MSSKENRMKDCITIEGRHGVFSAYVARPKALPAPTVVILHEVFGVNADIRKTCGEEAEQGFIIAASALAFADYLGYFFPVMKQNAAIFTYGSGDWTFRFGGAQVVASTLVAAFTVMNFFGVRRVARIQNAL